MPTVPDEPPAGFRRLDVDLPLGAPDTAAHRTRPERRKPPITLDGQPEPEKVVRLTHFKHTFHLPARRRRKGEPSETDRGVTVYGVDAEGVERVYATFPNRETFWAWVPTDPLAHAAHQATLAGLFRTMLERDPMFVDIAKVMPPKEEPVHAAWLVLYRRYWDRLGGAADQHPDVTAKATADLAAYWEAQAPPRPPAPPLPEPAPTPAELPKPPRARPFRRTPGVDDAR